MFTYPRLFKFQQFRIFLNLQSYFTNDFQNELLSCYLKKKSCGNYEGKESGTVSLDVSGS